MGYSKSYDNSSVILDDVPYTVSDAGIAKDQPPVGKRPYKSNNGTQSYSTYNFRTPNGGYGFVRTFQFTSGPTSDINFKGIGESLSSLSNLLITFMLLSMAKLLSGTASLLIGDLLGLDSDLKNRQ